MHTIVEKELKRQYPASEGWVLQPGPKKVGTNEIFSFTRRTGGKNEVVFVGITFERKVSDELIGELMALLKSPVASRSVSHLALIAPKDTDIKNVPSSVHMNWMRSFRFVDDDLLWLKHPNHRA
ncbi:MAG TPA: hypothetical protein VMS89_09175 [Methanoregulaceae archaeon]|nr:hypothetical protein [Methanoregulaceae archaeon]